jgi:hypothetical protein
MRHNVMVGRVRGCAALLVFGVALGLVGCKTDDGKDDAGVVGPRRDAGDLGATGGQCVTQCSTAADCCEGPQCNTAIFHYACELGTCRQIGCLSDGDCTDLAGGKCATVGGFALCGRGCRAVEDCCPPTPPGVVFPDGVDRLTVVMDGGVQATFYRCGTYPQKYICTGSDIAADDAGTTGVCLRVCNTNDECPGIPFPDGDGGLVDVRLDAGFVAIPLDGGVLRAFQQVCGLQFGPVGTCTPGCQTNSDCCPVPGECDALGARRVCQGGLCITDGCRGDEECGAAQCLPVPAGP